MDGFTGNHQSRRRGYLLLEVILSLGIAAALLSGIFAIASGSLSLADKVVTEGRAEGRREAFLSFLERNFSELPGNAEMELVTQDVGNRFLPTLTIQNAPASFAFAGLPISAQSIVLKTVPVPSGGVNVVLEYYQEQLLDNEGNSGDQSQEPVGSIILYRDIWRFEVRAFDSRSQEWVSDWDLQGQLPGQIELNAVFDSESEEVIHYFWIPTKVSPASLVQGIGQQQGANQRQNRGGNNGGRNSNNGGGGGNNNVPRTGAPQGGGNGGTGP